MGCMMRPMDVCVCVCVCVCIVCDFAALHCAYACRLAGVGRMKKNTLRPVCTWYHTDVPLMSTWKSVYDPCIQERREIEVSSRCKSAFESTGRVIGPIV